MYNNTANWYTDKFSVYRNLITETMGVSDTKRKLISKDNFGRIYRKSKPSLNTTPQAAQLQITDSLICDIDVDIKAGDEIWVLRGWSINKIKNEKKQVNIYIAGEPVDYYTPYGGVSPDISHKEVQLQNTLRTSATIEDEEAEE